MVYRIVISSKAEKELSKLDATARKRILAELRKVASSENPRSRGKALDGKLRGLWRYRAGDYRIVCDIRDDVLVVLVVDVGHRRDVYC